MSRILQMNISLFYSEPLIWRRILVSEEVSFRTLHYIVQKVMGWDNAHLHQFTIKDQRISGKTEVNKRLSQFKLKKGDNFFYVYDFRDSWDHHILIEEARAIKEEDPKVKCIDGANACPPEDCGGIPMYLQMLALMNTPEMPEEWSSWLPKNFDPYSFSVKQTNASLRNIGL